MKRRELIQLVGGALVSGVAETRAYSFLVNNPLASPVVNTMYRTDGHLTGDVDFYGADWASFRQLARRIAADREQGRTEHSSRRSVGYMTRRLSWVSIPSPS